VQTADGTNHGTVCEIAQRPFMGIIRAQLLYRKGTSMWHKEKVRVSSALGPTIVTRHLLVSFARRERIYPGEPRVWHPPTDVYETIWTSRSRLNRSVVEDEFAVRLDGAC